MQGVAVRSSLLDRWPCLPLAGMIAAVWPVWRWFGTRVASDPSEAWALLSVATAAALIWRERGSLNWSRVRWAVPALLVLVYAVSYPFVPPLVRALIAMTAVAGACSDASFGTRMDLRLWGLLLLSLPLIATLNFYLGYPLRVLVGEMTSALLYLSGFAALRDGTTLVWAGQRISIDAPCSGIKMLWTGAYLSCTLAALWRFNATRTLLLGACAFAVVMLANVLRATALFYVEVGIVPEAKAAHSSIGVIMFVFAAAALAAIAPLFGSRPQAATAESFPGWPAHFAGKPLRALPLGPVEQRFAADFPGRIGRFSDGEREIVIRWISQESRKLHPASDCFRGIGYRVTPQPLAVEADGTRWGMFIAKRGRERLQVRERIYDAAGSEWTDVSAWYWSAVMGRSAGPWWAVTVASKAQ